MSASMRTKPRPATNADHITVTLPDGTTRTVPADTTAAGLAEHIGPRLAADAVIAIINGHETDLNHQLCDGDHVGDCRALTRAEYITFLYRYAGLPATSGSNPWTDVDSEAYYFEPAIWASDIGIYGITDTTFGPDLAITHETANPWVNAVTNGGFAYFDCTGYQSS